MTYFASLYSNVLQLPFFALFTVKHCPPLNKCLKNANLNFQRISLYVPVVLRSLVYLRKCENFIFEVDSDGQTTLKLTFSHGIPGSQTMRAMRGLCGALGKLWQLERLAMHWVYPGVHMQN